MGKKQKIIILVVLLVIGYFIYQQNIKSDSNAGASGGKSGGTSSGLLSGTLSSVVSNLPPNAVQSVLPSQPPANNSQKYEAPVFECPDWIGAGTAPNCNNNFINQESTFTDPVTKKETKKNCCVPNPKAGQPSEVDKKWKMALDTIRQLVIGQAFFSAAEYLAKQLLQKSVKGALEKTGARLATNMATRVGTNVGRAAVSTVVRTTTTTGVRLGARLAIGATSLVTRLGAWMFSGPIGWALFAFQAISMVLDLFDVGSYGKLTYWQTWHDMKNEVDRTMDNERTKYGQKIPYCYIEGPDSNFPMGCDASGNLSPSSKEYVDLLSDPAKAPYPNPTNVVELNTYITVNYIVSYIALAMDNADLTGLTGADILEFCNKASAEATKFLESVEGNEFVEMSKCSFFNNSKSIKLDGQIYCTYDSKESCDNSFQWSVIRDCLSKRDVSGFKCTQEYVQWTTDSNNNSYCRSYDASMKSACEDNGIPYDYTNRMCTVTENYCLGKGVDFISSNSSGFPDCKMNLGQTIAEDIFGKTVTRGLIQVFDPNQYNPCPSDQYDGNNLPQELKIALGIAIIIPPISIYGILYNTMGNKMCFSKYGCLPGLVEEGGLCYVPCPAGYTSDKGKYCYKDYPGLNGTLIDIYMGQESKGPSIPDACPSGQFRNGLLCFPNCPPGYAAPTGNICTQQNFPPGVIQVPPYTFRNPCPSGQKDVIGFCQVDGPLSTEPGWSCPGGWWNAGVTCTRWVGGSCDPCPGGWWDAGATCSITHGVYWDGGCNWGAGCFRGGNTDTIWSRNCRLGYVETIGGSQDPCPPNYSNKAGICWTNISPTVNPSYVLDSKPNGAGNPAMCPANKQNVNGSCYDPCPPGYAMGPGGQGTCYQQCPAGSKPTNLIDPTSSATCIRESITRPDGIMPFTISMKTRKIPLGTGSTTPR